MADEVISKVRVPDGTSNVYVLKDEISRSRTEYETVTKTGNPLVLETGGQSVDSLVLSMEPIQDLHGYDHPWVGGAGKNLLVPLSEDRVSQGITIHQNSDGSITLNGTCSSTGLVITGTFKVEANTNYTVSIGNYDTSIISDYGLQGFSRRKVISNESDFLSDGIQIFTNAGTVFNNIVVWPQIEYGTLATYFEPYSNICPISGHTEADVWNDPVYPAPIMWNQHAKELVTENYVFGEYVNVSASDDVTTVSFTADGNKLIYDNRRGTEVVVPSNHVVYAKIIELDSSNLSTTYSLGYTIPSGGTTREVSTNKDWFLTRIASVGACGASIYFPNATQGDSITCKGFQFFDLTQMFGSTVADEIYAMEQAEAGSGVAWFRNLFPNDYYAYNAGTKTSVSAVNGNSYQHVTTPLGQTVYGGTYNFTTGELVVDKELITLTGNEIYYSENVFITNALAIVSSGFTSYKSAGSGKCSHFTAIDYAPTTDAEKLNSIWKAGNDYLGFKTNLFTTGAAAKEWVTEQYNAGTPVTYALELTEPITAQLTPQQLKTLVGTNIFTSENGTVEVTIRDGLFMLAGEEVDGAEWGKITGTMSDQTDLNNALSAINSDLSGLTNIVLNSPSTDWSVIQKQVEFGLAKNLYPVGTQFTVHHDVYGDMLFDVIGHDHDLSAGKEHSMTLLMHNVIYSTQFDEIEGFYYCADGLTAGTYNVTITRQPWFTDDVGKTFQFTLADDVPAGAILWWDGYNVTREGRTVRVYNTRGATSAAQTATMTEGNGGTALGSVDGTGNFNFFDRTVLGSNDWEESGVRQWLNADVASNWWEPKTNWDRLVNYYSRPGFLYGFDADFKNVLVETTHGNRSNTVYDSHGTNVAYSTTEKIFLLCNEEVNLAQEQGIVCGTVYDYYKNAANADRIKYDITSTGTARNWWLRSPYPSHASSERLVNLSGALNNSNADYGYGVAAACVIAGNENTSGSIIKKVEANEAAIDSLSTYTSVNVTLASSSWDSSTNVYTISNSKVTATSLQVVVPATGITDTQLAALQSANIQDYGQDAGHMYLKAYGDLPSVDVPVTVIFFPMISA